MRTRPVYVSRKIGPLRMWASDVREIVAIMAPNGEATIIETETHTFDSVDDFCENLKRPAYYISIRRSDPHVSLSVQDYYAHVSSLEANVPTASHMISALTDLAKDYRPAYVWITAPPPHLAILFMSACMWIGLLGLPSLLFKGNALAMAGSTVIPVVLAALATARAYIAPRGYVCIVRPGVRPPPKTTSEHFGADFVGKIVIAILSVSLGVGGTLLVRYLSGK